MGTVVIQSEQDAWDFISECRLGKTTPEGFDRIIFDGWPCLTVRLDPGDGLINRKITRAMSLLQSHIDLTYALAKYGVADARRLTVHDRANIEIDYAVRDGSTILEASLTKFAQTLARLPDRMTSLHAAMTAVGVAAVLASAMVTWKWLEANSQAETIGMILREQTTRHLATEAAHIKAYETIQKVSDNSIVLAHGGSRTKTATTTKEEQLAFVYSAETTPVTKLAATDYVTWRTAILDLAPQGGTLTWNGIVLQEPQAKAIKKKNLVAASAELRKARANGGPTAIETPWLTTVSHTYELPPPMRLGGTST